MIANLTEKRIKELWPNRSNRIFLHNHYKNEGHCIARMIETALKSKNIYKVCLLIDDTTTDNTIEVLQELKKKYWEKLQFKMFTFPHNFGLAKNMALQYAIECGMEEGDWALTEGGDFSTPEKTAQAIDEFTNNDMNVIARFNIPEWQPWYLFWKKAKSRPRILLWRHRRDIDWGDFDFVHENMFPSFYRLTNMGDYFARHHGIPSIGTLYHHGQNEDSLEEKKWKIHWYIVLWQLKRYVQLYNFVGGYEEVLKQIMRQAARTDDEIEAARKGWVPFVNHLTKKYINGDIPAGLFELYHWTQDQKETSVEYS